MTRRYRPSPAKLAAIVLCSLGTGCAHEMLLDKKACQESKCRWLPKGAIPQPAGTFTREFLNRQALRAEVDDFVIYRYEWANDGDRLNDFGERHIIQLSHRLIEGPALVLIEDSGDAALNGGRVSAVMNALTQRGISDAAARVQVGTPEAEGLGDDFPRITTPATNPGLATSGAVYHGLGGAFGGGSGR